MTGNEAPHDTTRPHDTTNRSSDHDHHAPTGTPDDGQDDKATEHADAHTIPSPRQSAAAQPSQRGAQRPTPRQGCSHPNEATDKAESHTAPNPVSATVKAGPDGALWITVDGAADVQQLTDKISAVCDMLTGSAVTPPVR